MNFNELSSWLMLFIFAGFSWGIVIQVKYLILKKDYKDIVSECGKLKGHVGEKVNSLLEDQVDVINFISRINTEYKTANEIETMITLLAIRKGAIKLALKQNINVNEISSLFLTKEDISRVLKNNAEEAIRLIGNDGLNLMVKES